MLLVYAISWLILALTEDSHASTVDHFPALVLSTASAYPNDHSALPSANTSHWVTQSSWDTQSVSLAASTADLFANPYGFSSLKKFEGDDGNSLLGSTVMFFNGYVAVSASGYGVFEGQVHIYKPLNLDTWIPITTIPSPLADLCAFGAAMAYSGTGTSLLIAAPGFDYHTGRVFLYHQIGNTWELNATFVSPLALGDEFGRSVAFFEDHVLIGTSADHVFHYSLFNGSWLLVQDLEDPVISDDTSVDALFGHVVRFHGEYAAISSLKDGGKVHVYKLLNETLTLSQTLSPINTTNTAFGAAISLTDRHLLISRVGTPIVLDNDVSLLSAGSFPAGEVFVFDLVTLSSSNSSASVTLWQQTAVIASPMDGDFSFGKSMDIYEDTIVIGTALFPNDGEGSAFTYSKHINDSAALDLMNTTLLSLSPDSIYLFQSDAINNQFYSTAEDTANISYASYTQTSREQYWELNQTFASPAGVEGYFGISVAVTKNFVAIGADGYNAIQGVLYLGSLLPRPTFAPTSSPTSSPTTVEPTSTPTSVPTASPTMRPTQDSAAAGAGGSVTATQAVQDAAKTTTIVILVFAAIVGAMIVIITLLCCCLCRKAPLATDKKKKKEEEDSPYTVHGPLDELDKETLPDYGPGELITAPEPMLMPMPYYPPYAPPMMMPMQMAYPMPWDMDKKKDEDDGSMDMLGDKKKADEHVPGDQPGAYMVNGQGARAGGGRVLRYWNHVTPSDSRLNEKLDQDKKQADTPSNGLPGVELVQGTRGGAGDVIDSNLLSLSNMAERPPWVPGQWGVNMPPPGPYQYPYYPQQQQWQQPMRPRYIDGDVLSPQEVNFVDQLFDPEYVRDLFMRHGQGPPAAFGGYSAPRPAAVPRVPRAPVSSPAVTSPPSPITKLPAASDDDSDGSLGHSSTNTAPSLGTQITNQTPFQSSRPTYPRRQASAQSMTSIDSKDSIHSVDSILGLHLRPSPATVPPAPRTSPTAMILPPPPLREAPVPPSPAPVSPPADHGATEADKSWARVLNEQRLREEEARRKHSALAHRLRSVQSTDTLPSIEVSLDGKETKDSLDEAESGDSSQLKELPSHYKSYDHLNSPAAAAGANTVVFTRTPRTPASALSPEHSGSFELGDGRSLVEQAKDKRRLLNLKSWKRPVAPVPAPSPASAPTPAPGFVGSTSPPVHSPAPRTLDRFMAMEDSIYVPNTPAADEPAQSDSSQPAEPYVSDRLQSIQEVFEMYRQRARQRLQQQEQQQDSGNISPESASKDSSTK